MLSGFIMSSSSLLIDITSWSYAKEIRSCKSGTTSCLSTSSMITSLFSLDTPSCPNVFVKAKEITVQDSGMAGREGKGIAGIKAATKSSRSTSTWHMMRAAFASHRDGRHTTTRPGSAAKYAKTITPVLLAHSARVNLRFYSNQVVIF